jgi:hypothetical protein
MIAENEKSSQNEKSTDSIYKYEYYYKGVKYQSDEPVFFDDLEDNKLDN